jgi:cytochrome c peroxidase
MKTTNTRNLRASLIGACFFIFALPLLTTSCLTEEAPPRLSGNLDLPETPYWYNGSEAFTATLGRVLFYDKNLSANNTVSCSSCHKQSRAFADDRKLSLGFQNEPTKRNSMAIQDLNFDLPLFWDGRESHLVKMVTRPIVDPVEMGFTDLKELATKLQNIPDYRILFGKAFRTEEVTPERIATALAAFVASIQSQVFVDMNNFSNLEGMAKTGAELFVSKYQCNGCHQLQDAHGYLEVGTFANIGLETNYTDNGLSEITYLPSDAGRFKIPSLRNVALTAPYMHDGRFETLEEVIDHYSENIQPHPNLHPLLAEADGTPKVFSISPIEKQAIIAFLNSMTSREMLTDVRFSDPFKQ